MPDMTLAEALALADQDSPLPHLAGQALKVLREHINASSFYYQRLNPHCQLRIGRSLAPDDKWHWMVVLPEGHHWRSMSGFLSLGDCMQSAATEGMDALSMADERWRKEHPTLTPKDC